MQNFFKALARTPEQRRVLSIGSDSGTYCRTYNRGFTLIELSIVLVIIGLIIGGVLAGQLMIENAANRKIVAQLDKYKTAASNFRNKYGCLPGDCQKSAQFGFTARGSYAGQGDGNGFIDGVWANAPSANGHYHHMGERPLFWIDLYQAGLINEKFDTATATTQTYLIPGKVQADFFPRAASGDSYVNLFYASGSHNAYFLAGRHYFQLSYVPEPPNGGALWAEPGLKVSQAYFIDNKIDNGLPGTGKMGAAYWDTFNTTGSPWAATADDTTCSHGSGANSRYSTNVDDGGNVNCAVTIEAGF